MNTLQTLFSPTELHRMWGACKIFIKNDTAPGVDGVTKQDFDGNSKFEILKISKRVLSGDYGYQPLRPIPIDKGNGKLRIISVPTIADRFVQRCVLQTLLKANAERWRTGIGFGALTAESTHDVLRKVKSSSERYRWAIKSDISSYFDCIDRALIKKEVRRRVRQRSLVPLIESAIDCEPDLSNPNDRKAFYQAGLKLGTGVRQGMTLSPLLAYLFLLDEDRTTTEGRFFRYVDDIVFFGDSREGVRADFNHYRQKLEGKHLKLAEHKTKEIEPRHPLEFLGIDILRDGEKTLFSIPKKAKARVLQNIEQACDFRTLSTSKQRGWLVRTASYLRGVRRSYEYTYGFCENWPGFKQEITEKQRHACRMIAKRLSETSEAIESRKLLYRLFGVTG